MAVKFTPEEQRRFAQLFGDGDAKAAEAFFAKIVTLIRDALAGAPKLVEALAARVAKEPAAGAGDGQFKAFFEGLGLTEVTPEAFKTYVLALSGEAAGQARTDLGRQIDELPENQEFVGAISDALANAERTDRQARIRRIRAGVAKLLSEGLAEGQPPLKPEAIAFELANAMDRRFHVARYTQESEFLEHLRTAWETFVSEMAKIIEPLIQKKYQSDAPAIARWLLADIGVTERRTPEAAKAAINGNEVFREKLLASQRTKAAE